jgi:hypothetical protein
MSVEQIREKVLGVVDSFHQYDYIAFTLIIALFFMLIILSIVIRERKGLALSIIFLSVVLLTVGPILSYFKVHSTLYGTDYNLTVVKRLNFTDVLLIRGEIEAQGSEPLQKCDITTYITRQPDSFLEGYQELYLLKPLHKRSQTLYFEDNLTKGEKHPFRVRVAPYTYSKEINSSHIFIYRNCE